MKTPLEILKAQFVILEVRADEIQCNSIQFSSHAVKPTLYTKLNKRHLRRGKQIYVWIFTDG